MKVKVLSIDGKASGRSVTLDKQVFESEPNDHAIWLDVRRIQASSHQGTHKAKERGEVTGSTRKLYRQKGTGGARAGSAKSPIRKSGGTTFGPRVRTYGIKVNRKTQRLARRSAAAYKAKGKAVWVVEDFSFDEPDTNGLRAIVDALDLGGKKVLLLTGENQPTLHLSARNLPKLRVRQASSASTLDLVAASAVVIQEGALQPLTQALS